MTVLRWAWARARLAYRRWHFLRSAARIRDLGTGAGASCGGDAPPIRHVRVGHDDSMGYGFVGEGSRTLENEALGADHFEKLNALQDAEAPCRRAAAPLRRALDALLGDR